MAGNGAIGVLRIVFATVVVTLGSVGYALSLVDRRFVVPETLSLAFLGVGGFLLGPAFAGQWRRGNKDEETDK